MAVISAKKITDALAKARDIGVTEEPLTICDATIVLRNLRPDEYTAVYEDNKEREGLDSLYSFQKGHLCRSIVEINGVDLREADFVEVEEEVIDPKTQEAVIDPQTNEPKVKKSDSNVTISFGGTCSTSGRRSPSTSPGASLGTLSSLPRTSPRRGSSSSSLR